MPSEPRDQRGLAVGLLGVLADAAQELADVTRQLLPRELRTVAVDDSALGTDDLAQRPVDDP